MKKLVVNRSQMFNKIASIIKNLILISETEYMHLSTAHLKLLARTSSLDSSKAVSLRNELGLLMKSLGALSANKRVDEIEDDIFSVLIFLAEFSPANEYCVVEWKPIKQEDKVFLSNGHQHNINHIVTFINQKEAFREPFTNEALSSRDIKHIIFFAGNKKALITPFLLSANKPEETIGVISYFRWVGCSFFGRYPQPHEEQESDLTLELEH